MKCLEKKRRYRYYYFVTTCKDLELKDIVMKVNHWECAILKFINNLRKKYDKTTWFGTNVEDFEEDLLSDKQAEQLVLKSTNEISPICVFNLNNKIHFVTDIIELKYDKVTNGIAEYDRVILPRKEDVE